MGLFRSYALPYGVRKPELADPKEPVSFLDLKGKLFHAIRIDREQAFRVDFSLRYEDSGAVHGVEIYWNNGTTTAYSWEAGSGICYRWKTGEYATLLTQDPTLEPS